MQPLWSLACAIYSQAHKLASNAPGKSKALRGAATAAEALGRHEDAMGYLNKANTCLAGSVPPQEVARVKALASAAAAAPPSTNKGGSGGRPAASTAVAADLPAAAAKLKESGNAAYVVPCVRACVQESMLVGFARLK